MHVETVVPHMTTVRASPGPAAAQAYRLGIVASAIAGLAGVAFLYWAGAISPLIAAYVVVLLFPMYMVLVSVALSVWLGYDKDETALRPVYRPKDSE